MVNLFLFQSPFVTLRWPYVPYYLEFKITLKEFVSRGPNTYMYQVQISGISESIIVQSRTEVKTTRAT